MSTVAVHEAPRDLGEIDALRKHGPIVRVRAANGAESWMVLSYPVVKQLLGDHRLGREALVKENVPYRAAFPDYLKSTLMFTDDPEHARLRKSVAKWFTARRVEQLRARTIATAHRLLDEAEQAGGSVELIEAYAAQLPIDVLVNLLGADETMTSSFLEWTRILMGTAPQDPSIVSAAHEACATYLRAEIRAKREAPGEDLLSAMAAIPVGPDSMTDDEILSVAMLILLAGFDNTANTIGSGVYALLGHPEELERYLADVEGGTAALSEEILRHGRQSMGSGLTVAGVPFIALEDIEIADVTIRAGDFVTANRNAANHDGEVFDEPLRLDVTRSPNPHFGLSHGIHHCLGAPLARMELQVAFSVLFSRYPKLALDGKPTYLPDTISQPILTLPVLLAG